MARLINVELFKLRQRLMTWILLAILLAIIVLIYVVFWTVTEVVSDTAADRGLRIEALRRALYLQQAVPFGLQFIAGFGAVLAAILAAGAVGSEYGWGTIRNMLTCSPSRASFLAAKLMAVAVLTVAGALLGVVTSLLVSGIITQVGGGADYSFVDAGYIGRSCLSFVRAVYTMAPYVLLAFFVAVWGRSTLAGVAAGIGINFLEGIISGLMRLAGGVWQEIPKYLLDANRDALLVANGLQEDIGIGPTREEVMQGLADPWQAALVLGLWSLLFLVLSFVIFQRRDVTSS